MWPVGVPPPSPTISLTSPRRSSRLTPSAASVFASYHHARATARESGARCRCSCGPTTAPRPATTPPPVGPDQRTVQTQQLTIAIRPDRDCESRPIKVQGQQHQTPQGSTRGKGTTPQCRRGCRPVRTRMGKPIASAICERAPRCRREGISQKTADGRLSRGGPTRAYSATNGISWSTMSTLDADADLAMASVHRRQLVHYPAR